jgi:hypothetical protein
MASTATTTVASKVPFYQLSVLLDKLNDLDGKDRKKKLLKDFIDEWRAFHSKLHETDGNTVGCIQSCLEYCSI